MTCDVASAFAASISSKASSLVYGVEAERGLIVWTTDLMVGHAGFSKWVSSTPVIDVLANWLYVVYAIKNGIEDQLGAGRAFPWHRLPASFVRVDETTAGVENKAVKLWRPTSSE